MLVYQIKIPPIVRQTKTAIVTIVKAITPLRAPPIPSFLFFQRGYAMTTPKVTTTTINSHAQ